jgi:hypothetical protein
VGATPLFGEDATLWRDSVDGTFHLLFNAVYPHRVGAAAWSADGLTWVPTYTADTGATNYAVVQAWTKDVPDGPADVASASRKGKPFVLVDAAGVPTHLYSGVRLSADSDWTYAHVEPVRSRLEDL